MKTMLRSFGTYTKTHRGAKIPISEQLGNYFCQGLNKELRSAVVGFNTLANMEDFNNLVEAVTRV